MRRAPSESASSGGDLVGQEAEGQDDREVDHEDPRHHREHRRERRFERLRDHDAPVGKGQTSVGADPAATLRRAELEDRVVRAALQEVGGEDVEARRSGGRARGEHVAVACDEVELRVLGHSRCVEVGGEGLRREDAVQGAVLYAGGVAKGLRRHEPTGDGAHGRLRGAA